MGTGVFHIMSNSNWANPTGKPKKELQKAVPATPVAETKPKGRLLPFYPIHAKEWDIRITITVDGGLGISLSNYVTGEVKDTEVYVVPVIPLDTAVNAAEEAGL